MEKLQENKLTTIRQLHLHQRFEIYQFVEKMIVKIQTLPMKTVIVTSLLLLLLYMFWWELWEGWFY